MKRSQPQTSAVKRLNVVGVRRQEVAVTKTLTDRAGVPLPMATIDSSSLPASLARMSLIILN